MLVCDLDGTLIDSKGIVTGATVAALLGAEAAGIEVVFATGRRHKFAHDVLAPLGLRPETVLISSNGAITRTLAGETIGRRCLPVSTAVLLCRLLANYRDCLVFTFDHTGMGALVVEDIGALHQTMERWVRSNLHEIKPVVPLERAFEPDAFETEDDRSREPIQAMVCGTLERMASAMDVLENSTPECLRLRQTVSIQRTEYVRRNLCIVDLLPLGCSKGNALADLAGLRGIDAAEIVAIGDNMNDVDMLEFAGYATVMANAAPELLAMAAERGWRLTASNDEDGVARAIVRMFDILVAREDTDPEDRTVALVD